MSARTGLAGCIIVSFLSVSLTLVYDGSAIAARRQTLSSLDSERGREMLRQLKNDIRKNYYDPEFHGIDLEVRFKAADEKVRHAQSVGQVFSIIAQVLNEFNDSHLLFIPPDRASSIEYGWYWQIIGDKCFVFAIKPGSDAESKGLKPGDRVLTIDSYVPDRENAWKLDYVYKGLRPRLGMRVAVESPNGNQHELDVLAKVTPGVQVITLGPWSLDYYQRLAENEAFFLRDRSYEVEDAVIWKMQQFGSSEAAVDKMMGKARKHKTLILDLRGNGGGYVTTLQRLLGHFFDHDVKIADLKGRRGTKELVAKTRGDSPFAGKLIVVIDSRSASASELFARTIQLTKRGMIIGDRSAGAVMQSKIYEYRTGLGTMVFYGASITDADVVMPDGKSLEHTGVQPDELSLPTGAELAEGKDKVLSRAAELAGAKLDPEKAGTLFPIEWRK